MTGKQLAAAEEEWRRTGGTAIAGIELSCIQVIHAILIYQYRPDSEEFPFPKTNHSLYDYFKKLGMERVKTLWEEQIKDFRHAKVGHAGFDPDGCQFNYCQWADESSMFHYK